MSKKVRERGATIRNFLLRKLADSTSPMTVAELCAAGATQFGVTKSAISKHIKELQDSIVFVDDGGRSKKCFLKQNEPVEFDFKIDGPGCLDESEIFRKQIRPLLSSMCSNALNILDYGFSEMFNNVMDHSGATQAKIILIQTALTTTIFIIDNGVGIFKKVKDALNLPDERQSLLELSKGKFTTDPANHSGEGIFFTSRACDVFAIVSNDLVFTHTNEAAHDLLTRMHNPDNAPGTLVMMSMANNSPKTLTKFFNQFSSVDAGFYATEVPVKLVQYENEGLLSRSQAKRLLARIDRFKFVTFDFENVTFIGQAFADQIFRVFKNAHPEVTIDVKNASQVILDAIQVAQNNVVG